MKTKIIQIPIFRKTLQVIFGDKEYTRKVLLEEYSIPEHSIDNYVSNLCSDDSLGTFCHFPDDDGYYIWMPEVPERIYHYGALIHEIQHFVFFMLESIGINHTDDSDEVYSYLMEYVFNEIDLFINETDGTTK